MTEQAKLEFAKQIIRNLRKVIDQHTSRNKELEGELEAAKRYITQEQRDDV